VAANGSVVSNYSNGGYASQDIASNAGTVQIKGFNIQDAFISNSFVRNEAFGGKALQNLSSNSGKVTVAGFNLQSTSLYNSSVLNRAAGKGSVALQNIASNSSCGGDSCPQPNDCD
jgi:hypothetical protein